LVCIRYQDPDAFVYQYTAELLPSSSVTVMFNWGYMEMPVAVSAGTSLVNSGAELDHPVAANSYQAVSKKLVVFVANSAVESSFAGSFGCESVSEVL